MSNASRSLASSESKSLPKIVIDNDNKNSEENANFLQHLDTKSRHHAHHHQHQQQLYNLKKSNIYNKNNSSIPSTFSEQTAPNLLEIKQQRLLAAADRKKRIITRIISIVGLLIILLCVVIVTFTLKMAPKIDELVRTKTGKYNLMHQLSRVSTPLAPLTMELNSSIANNSSMLKFPVRTRRRLFI
ncbi:unnamed protein product [Rotaria socialis]|uniref:Uncharacterized protein n=1 Tax=Rotaria socialis TaxID=392032 RepID=A0A818ZXQ4_9BILA|nr:unnamed protein product [Rotaria socialis]CAF4444394.1 unnamed protein product [Rotaria socialis]